MSAWTETLSQFSAAIRTGAALAPGTVICPHYPSARGLEVYRNNYRGNLHDSLASAFPVIWLLVGEDFFRLLARRYIEQYPSRSGNLHHYGDGMAAFLATFENTQHLAYLPDMARLEWAYHLAYFMADQQAFDLKRLATVAPQDYSRLRWRLHPSCTLLTSAYPVIAIWQAHQDGAAEDFRIDLDSGGDNLIVYRNSLNVAISNISDDDRHWLAQLQSGVTLGAATDAALSVYPFFDLATTLRHWLAQSVLIDFDFTAKEKT